VLALCCWAARRDWPVRVALGSAHVPCRFLYVPCSLFSAPSLPTPLVCTLRLPRYSHRQPLWIPTPTPDCFFSFCAGDKISSHYTKPASLHRFPIICLFSAENHSHHCPTEERKDQSPQLVKCLFVEFVVSSRLQPDLFRFFCR